MLEGIKGRRPSLSGLSIGGDSSGGGDGRGGNGGGGGGGNFVSSVESDLNKLVAAHLAELPRGLVESRAETVVR